MTTDVAAPPAEIGVATDALARTHFRVASLFLIFGALAGLALAIQLSAPDVVGAGPLSYGRLYPLFTGALLFGWMTIGLIGAIYYLLPRLTGGPIQDLALARVSLVLVAGGTLLGLVGVALGDNQGLPTFEFPYYADIVLIVGFAGVTGVVSRTAVAHREPRVYVSVWFFVAAVWWLLFAYIVGSVSWFRGADLEVANRFAEAGLLLLWVIPVGIGIAYYLIPKLTDSALYSRQLAMVSFWALAGSFVWVGAHNFTFGPAADWLETINVMFGIALLIPIMAVVANLLLSVDWRRAGGSTPLRLALAGTAFFALLGVQVLGLAFRASSTVVQFTTWTEATFVIAVLGAGTMWLTALLVHLRGGGPGPFRLAGAGLAVLVATLWLGGLLAGFVWTAGPRSKEFDNFGEGFVNTTTQMAGFDAVRWGAWALIAAGLIWSGWRTLTSRSWEMALIGEPSQGVPDTDPGAVAPDKVALAAVLIIGVAFITTVLLPALDSSDEQPTARAVNSRDYEAFGEGAPAPQAAVFLGELGLEPLVVAEGRDVYVSEGCVYCHTQQVRANVADVGLGPVTLREDVMLASPALLGRIRLGPDLSHAGARGFTNDVARIREHLVDPRADRGWSSMPSYDYLSDDELNALAQYIVSLH